MLSPYFSPGEIKRQNSPFKAVINRHEQDTSDNVRQSTGMDLTHSPTVTEDPWFHDPLFHFYVRKFLNLYQFLSVLKPKLIQESVADDPWKLLIAVTLLNKTTGRVAVPVFWDIIKKWATPWAMSQSDPEELRRKIHRLGTYNIRSQRLIKISKAYVLDPPSTYDVRSSQPSSPTKLQTLNKYSRERYPPTPVSHLPGTGPYALDSYRNFCSNPRDPFCGEWKVVRPSDKELILYLRWKWAYEERKEWFPQTGHVEFADIPYLEMLVNELPEYHIRRGKYGR